jgi:5-methyltetrahydrofolate--homocysteine methyltransferase
MEETLKAVYQGIIDGDMGTVQEKTQSGIDGGIGPEVILNEALVPAMAEVGRRFEVGEYFVPEMLIAARAMQAGMAILKPKLLEKDIKPIGKVLVGTVKGDLHDIGKNLVAMMLEGAGFEIQDAGVDVSPEQFVELLREGSADIIAMSALLTTTMTTMKATIDALNEAGLRDQVKVMVGGAPVTDAFAAEIGADGSAPDAGQAAKLAQSLMA